MINDDTFPSLASTGAPVGSYYGDSPADTSDRASLKLAASAEPVGPVVEVSVTDAIKDPKMRKAHGMIFGAGAAVGVVLLKTWQALRGGVVIGGRRAHRRHRGW
jgi:hypothetical protein